MILKNTRRKISSFLDFITNFDWEEVKKDPDQRAKASMIWFALQILVTASIVFGTLLFIYLKVFH